MKKLYPLLLLALMLTFNANAQTISSFIITPANPTTTDTIEIVIECIFPSGSCDGIATYSGMNNNIITADAFHCLGMLTVICTDYDTIVIPPLSAGQYSFVFLLSTGQGIPCTPGIVPDAVDTLNFIVDDVTGINLPSGANPFSIISDPFNGKLIVKCISDEAGTFSIFSSDGKLLHSQSFNTSEFEIEKPQSPGYYILIAESKNKVFSSKLVIVN